MIAPLLMLAAASAAAPPEAIVPEGWEGTVEELHYSPAVKVGKFVYLSGVVATLGGANAPGAPAPTMQQLDSRYSYAFELIGVILEEAGSDWDHVVEIVTYHTELREQIDGFALVKDRYITEPYPAWTAIDVDRLYPDDGITEIKIVAVVAED